MWVAVGSSIDCMASIGFGPINVEVVGFRLVGRCFTGSRRPHSCSFTYYYHPTRSSLNFVPVGDLVDRSFGFVTKSSLLVTYWILIM
jgi:hypothetical protein